MYLLYAASSIRASSSSGTDTVIFISQPGNKHTTLINEAQEHVVVLRTKDEIESLCHMYKFFAYPSLLDRISPEQRGSKDTGNLTVLGLELTALWSVA